MSIWNILDPLGLFAPTVHNVEMTEATQPTTAQEGRYIGVLWGTRDIKNLDKFSYFGDVKQVAIKEKATKK